MTAGASTVSASKMATRWTAPRDPEDDSARVAAPEATTETWADRVYAALPLFIVGGACLFVSIDLFYSGTTNIFGNSSVRLYPWALFFALAVTGLAAGTFALLVEEETPTPVQSETVEGTPAAPTPDWDESMLPPETPTYVHPRTWERYPELPTEVGWSPAEPKTQRVSPDVVLIQIDEIAASLRKKPPASESP